MTKSSQRTDLLHLMLAGICLDFGIILASFKFIQTLEIYAHINICQNQETIKAGTELFLLSLLFKAGNCPGQIIKPS